MLTNYIIEQYNFKKVNNSTWRLAELTIQNTWDHSGETIYDKIFNTKRAYKVCWNGKYLTTITLLSELKDILPLIH